MKTFVRYHVSVDFLCIFVDIRGGEYLKCGHQTAYAILECSGTFVLVIHKGEPLS